MSSISFSGGTPPAPNLQNVLNAGNAASNQLIALSTGDGIYRNKFDWYSSRGQKFGIDRVGYSTVNDALGDVPYLFVYSPDGSKLATIRYTDGAATGAICTLPAGIGTLSFFSQITLDAAVIENNAGTVTTADNTKSVTLKTPDGINDARHTILGFSNYRYGNLYNSLTNDLGLNLVTTAGKYVNILGINALNNGQNPLKLCGYGDYVMTGLMTGLYDMVGGNLTINHPAITKDTNAIVNVYQFTSGAFSPNGIFVLPNTGVLTIQSGNATCKLLITIITLKS